MSQTFIQIVFYYFMSLSFWSSLAKSGLYALLGTFAEVFPEHMIGQSDRLVSIYVNVLKSEVL